ncbi:peptidoglycan-binding domain-containing protein [Yoonia algicola]|uniref:Peptidoglycan-binding domain-containing protein n=1 Tax=Yoonia algicola TaxID=3137368 RepID=A0AAN0NE98_9RHOB
MIARLLLHALWLGLTASSLVAAPCVSNTFDRPLPGATSVVSHVSDVPSAQFPAFWQDGVVNGYAYTIFASAEGTLRPTDAFQDWEIKITCDVSAQTCEMSRVGIPPEDAEIVSRSIGQCLLGAEVEAVAPVPVAAAVPATDPINAAVAPETVGTSAKTAKVVCRAASVEETDDVAALQRLLVIAGENPGQVDGVLGPKSISAIEAFSPGSSANRTVPELISLLETYLCGPQNG